MPMDVQNFDFDSWDPDKVKWTERDELAFQRWYASILHSEPSMEPYGRNPDPDDPRHYYDQRGFWKAFKPPMGIAGIWNEETQSYHGMDEWKQPGSPEDIYGEHQDFYRPPEFYLNQIAGKKTVGEKNKFIMLSKES